MITINIHGDGLSKMCRICLSGGVTLVNLYTFSTKLEARIVDEVMACAPVHIMRNDQLPPFICKLCYVQLEKVHQFRVRAINSEKTMRHYLNLLHSRKNYFTRSDRLLESRCTSSDFHDFCPNNSNDNSVKTDALGNEIYIKQDTDDYMDTNDLFRKYNHKVDICHENLSNNINGCSRNKEPSLAHIKKEFNDSNLDEVTGDVKVNQEDANVKPFQDQSIKIEQSINKSIMTHSGISNENNPHNHKNKKLPLINSKRQSDQKRKFVKTYNEHKLSLIDNKRTHKLTNSTSIHSNDNIVIIANKHTHTNAKPQHQCTVCNKYFTNVGNLKIHQRLHTGVKPYQCDICGKSFTHSSVMKRHQSVHTGEKPYQCDICHKSFTQSCNLSVHKRIHSGERFYQCDVCGAAFALMVRLKRHKRLHTGERPYVCEICDKGFTQVNNLKRHILVHSGDKPYGCDICNRSFTQLTHMKQHRKRHTFDKSKN